MSAPFHAVALNAADSPWARCRASARLDLAGRVGRATKATMDVLALPFDAMRFAYARAVNAGRLPRSMLANRDFERSLGALERLTLGLWARRV